jgi:uncharacterized protein YbcV (DUF1398 family)
LDIAAQDLIREAARGSGDGRLHFGQVIGLMQQAGVESYAADYRTGRTTYYLPDGATLGLAVEMPDVPIARDFDVDAVRSAIRGAQQGVVMYPQFKRLTRLAGCIGYTVWIAGRHVTYFGRKGEMHIEPFPT